MKRNRKLMIALASVFVFLATSAGAFWAYVGDYYHADMEAIQSYGIHLFGRKMQSEEEIAMVNYGLENKVAIITGTNNL